jgi:catechol 2,3-dioxygenase
MSSCCVKSASLPPSVRIGHAHLRVADLERATAFYRDVLGFQVSIYGPAVGLEAVFLSAGDYHHHIALNTWHSKDGPPCPQGHTGLHHVAILYPDVDALGTAVRRVLEQRYPIDDARDHGASVAVYLRDPDGNGLELYFDRPTSYWYDVDGKPVLKNDPIDIRELLEDARAA